MGFDDDTKGKMMSVVSELCLVLIVLALSSIALSLHSLNNQVFVILQKLDDAEDT